MTIRLRDEKGRFVKGNIPWNKDKKGIHLSPDTEFKKGFTPWNKGKKISQLRGENNPNWKGGKVKMRCIVCGKEFYRDRCDVKRAKFCSHSCKAKYLFKLKNGHNYNWKGGITKNREKLKHSEQYKKWRLKVFQRDRFTCQLCGHRSKKSRAHGDKRSDIEAHHIIPVSENPKLVLKVGNGITLCRNCHRKTYGKEKEFATVFTKILRDYTPNIPKG